MFPRYTLETSNFRDPTERGPNPTVEREIHRLYTEGLPPMPTPQPISRAELLPLPFKDNISLGMDEDRLRRLYDAAVFLMQKPTDRRVLTRDQMVAVTDKIHKDLMKDYDPSIVDD
jgi:hypothetical protein